MELNSKELITVRFKLDDEEHLIPKNILFKSSKIRKLIEDNGENPILHIDTVASEAFFMLIHHINGVEMHQTPEQEHKMVEAAKHLELTNATLKLQKLANRLFPKQP